MEIAGRFAQPDFSPQAGRTPANPESNKMNIQNGLRLQSRAAHNLQERRMPNPIVHFEVLGKDKAVLEDFYTAAFDWQLNPAMDNYSMISPGGGINGGIGTSMDGGVGHATFYVEVANIP